MAKIDITYHNLLEKIIQEGYTYEDPNRKGVNRIEIPSYTFRHEFKDGFPVITTKKLNYKSVVTELIWFLAVRIISELIGVLIILSMTSLI